MTFYVIYQNHNIHFWPLNQEDFKELSNVAMIKTAPILNDLFM